MDYSARKKQLIEKHNQALQQAQEHDAAAVNLRKVASEIVGQVQLLEELQAEGEEDG